MPPASQVIQKSKTSSGRPRAVGHCERPECFADLHSKGLCRRHYNQVRQAVLYQKRVDLLGRHEVAARRLASYEEAKAKRYGSPTGRVVIYSHPIRGLIRGVVPAPRRCRGCCGWATHWWRGDTSNVRNDKGGKIRGYAICLECISLWKSYNRTGVVSEMPEGYGVGLV